MGRVMRKGERPDVIRDRTLSDGDHPALSPDALLLHITSSHLRSSSFICGSKRLRVLCVSAVKTILAIAAVALLASCRKPAVPTREIAVPVMRAGHAKYEPDSGCFLGVFIRADP